MPRFAARGADRFIGYRNIFPSTPDFTSCNVSFTAIDVPTTFLLKNT